MAYFKKLRETLAKQASTVKIAWIGLDLAGKTSLVNRLVKDEFIDNYNLTQGMSIDEFDSGEVHFISWDIGGQLSFRETLWDVYVEGSMGLIFVIDAAAPERFPEAKEVLWKHVFDKTGMKSSDSQVGIPVLILANKQDLSSAKTAGFVARALDLHKITLHSYCILPTSALTGFNVEIAMEWLRERITEKIVKIEL